MKRTLQESGFSLLELVITVGILTIVMGVAFQLLNRSQVSFDRNQILNEAHANADFAVLRIAEVLRGGGSNPANSTNINALNFFTTPATNEYRIISDYDGDGASTSRLITDVSNPRYYIIGSEDVSIKWYPTETSEGGRTIPANSICLIDRTPGPGVDEPIVIASNIVGFEITGISQTAAFVTVTITGGPSRQMSQTDPRYATFTRTTQIRLRNR